MRIKLFKPWSVVRFYVCYVCHLFNFYLTKGFFKTRNMNAALKVHLGHWHRCKSQQTKTSSRRVRARFTSLNEFFHSQCECARVVTGRGDETMLRAGSSNTARKTQTWNRASPQRWSDPRRSSPSWTCTT